MAFDENLAERVRQSTALPRSFAERRMFGGLAIMVDGHMAFGVSGNRLMARVGPEQHEAMLARPHVSPMDFTGKPMRGYVYVSADGIRTQDALDEWIARCVGFVKTLPKKAKEK